MRILNKHIKSDSFCFPTKMLTVIHLFLRQNVRPIKYSVARQGVCLDGQFTVSHRFQNRQLTILSFVKKAEKSPYLIDDKWVAMIGLLKSIKPFKERLAFVSKGRMPMLIVGIAFLMLSQTSMAANQAEVLTKDSSKNLRRLARIYTSYGDYSNAQELTEQSLELARAYDDNDKEISLCLINLAWVYKEQMQFEKAAQSCEEGLELQKNIYSENHPNIAYTLRILGSSYRGLKDYTKALDVLEQAIAIMLEYHDPDDQAVASFHIDVANLLLEKGQLPEAESKFTSALEIINKSYGPTHLYTARINGYVARLYALKGEYQKAATLIDQALAIQQEVYGEKHHFLVPALLTKALIKQGMHEYIQAQSLSQKSLKMLEKVYGIQHIRLLEVLKIQENLYRKTGNQLEANNIKERLNEIYLLHNTEYDSIAKAN